MIGLIDYITEAAELKFKQVNYMPSGVLTGKTPKYTILALHKEGLDLYNIAYFDLKKPEQSKVFFTKNLNSVEKLIEFYDKKPHSLWRAEIGEDGEIHRWMQTVDPKMPKKLQEDINCNQSDIDALYEEFKKYGIRYIDDAIYDFVKKGKDWTLDLIKKDINELGVPVNELKKLNPGKKTLIKYNDGWYGMIERGFGLIKSLKYDFDVLVTESDSNKPDKYMYKNTKTPLDLAMSNAETLDTLIHNPMRNGSVNSLVILAADEDFLYENNVSFRILKPVNYSETDEYNLIEVELVPTKYKLKPLEESLMNFCYA